MVVALDVRLRPVRVGLWTDGASEVPPGRPQHTGNPSQHRCPSRGSDLDMRLVLTLPRACDLAPGQTAEPACEPGLS